MANKVIPIPADELQKPIALIGRVGAVRPWPIRHGIVGPSGRPATWPTRRQVTRMLRTGRWMASILADMK
jgi:hypothetical protein